MSTGHRSTGEAATNGPAPIRSDGERKKQEEREREPELLPHLAGAAAEASGSFAAAAGSEGVKP
uniref:Uncharacterized protein n=1 Tax=Oryza barthii TaxID=65489 RepID=A0A0D3H5M8_9ORYZ